MLPLEHETILNYGCMHQQFKDIWSYYRVPTSSSALWYIEMAIKFELDMLKMVCDNNYFWYVD